MNAKLSFIEKHEVVAEDIFLNIGNGLIDIELNEKKRTQQQLALFNHLKSLLQFDNIDDENKNLDALNLLSSDQIQSLSIFFTQKIFHLNKKIKEQECDIFELRSRIHQLEKIFEKHTTF
jgi:hypothetical protein